MTPSCPPVILDRCSVNKLMFSFISGIIRFSHFLLCHLSSSHHLFLEQQLTGASRAREVVCGCGLGVGLSFRLLGKLMVEESRLLLAAHGGRLGAGEAVRGGLRKGPLRTWVWSPLNHGARVTSWAKPGSPPARFCPVAAVYSHSLIPFLKMCGLRKSLMCAPRCSFIVAEN